MGRKRRGQLLGELLSYLSSQRRFNIGLVELPHVSEGAVFRRVEALPYQFYGRLQSD